MQDREPARAKRVSDAQLKMIKLADNVPHAKTFLMSGDEERFLVLERLGP